MRHVQLEHVGLGQLRRRHEQPECQTLVVSPRDLAEGAVGLRRWRHDWPPVREWQVPSVRARPTRPSPPGMSKLEEHLSIRGPNPLVDHRRLRRDPPVRRDGHEPARLETEPIREVPPRRESRRRRHALPAEPRIQRPNELRIPDPEARVRDPPAARQQVERELQRLHLRVRSDPPEVRRGIARRGLRPLHHRRALELVVDERRLDLPAAPHEPVRERDRVLHRQLRPRPDREVRGVRRVAEEHDPPVVPDPVRHLREVEPERAVREELAAAEVAREELLAEREALLLVHRVEAGRAPHVLRALDDERAHALVVGVGVDVEEPVLGLLEDEGEGVEDEVGAEPDVLRALRLDARAELAERADERVRAVGADDEVGLGERRRPRRRTRARRRACAPAAGGSRAGGCGRSPRTSGRSSAAPRPRKRMSSRFQRAKVSVISRWDSGSASRSAPSVSSLKTTPQPKVASGALRSRTRTSAAPAFLSRIAR